jgi:hypothetical protein
MVAQAGIPSGATFYTNAVRCRTPKDRIPTSDEISACSGWLAEEIGVLEPVAIVLLGKAAEIAYERIKDELTFDYKVFRLVEPEKAWKDKRKRDAYQESLDLIGRYLKGEDIGALPIIEPEPWSEGVPDLASPWLAVDTEGDSLEADRAEKMVCWQLSDGHKSTLGLPQDWAPLDHVWLHHAKFDAPQLGSGLGTFGRPGMIRHSWRMYSARGSSRTEESRAQDHWSRNGVHQAAAHAQGARGQMDQADQARTAQGCRERGHPSHRG